MGRAQSLCFAACLALLSPALHAQTPSPQAPVLEPATGVSLENRLKQTIRELNFEHGGAVYTAIDTLREATGANIIMDTGVRGEIFGELKLRNVTLKTALDALVVAADGTIVMDYSGNVSPDLIAVRQWHTGDPNLKTVSRAFQLPAWPDADFDKNLKGLLSAMKRAVELRNEAQQGAPPLPMPKFEGHRATHLLLVAGPRASVEIIGRTLAASEGEKYDEHSGEEKKGDDDSDDGKKDADGNSGRKADNDQ